MIFSNWEITYKNYSELRNRNLFLGVIVINFVSKSDQWDINQNFTESLVLFQSALSLSLSLGPPLLPCRTFHRGTAASFRKQPSHCKTRRPPIDVRVNERRPRQQRVTEPGDKRFTPRYPLPSPDDRPLEFRGWLWLSTANECATGSAFWSITRARGYCRLVKQHLDPAGKRAEGFSFWTALSGRGVPYGRKLAILEYRGWRRRIFY